MDMIQVFKIVQNIHDIFEFADTQTRSNSKKLKKHRALKTFRMNSFCVRTTNKWNGLPSDTVNFKTVPCFKTLYDRYMDRVKRIWYLSPIRAAKVQASSESRGTFRQKARFLAPLNGWACAVKICHDGMLEDTNSLDGAHIHN